MVGFSKLISRPSGWFLFYKTHTVNTKDAESQFLEAQQIILPCRLLAVEKTNQAGLRYKLSIYDQQGQKLREIFRVDNPDPITTVKLYPVLSPSGNYVSYVVYSGKFYYDNAQFQDVEVVNVSSPDQPIRLTKRGGAEKKGGVWSLKGDQIAFTDYDEQGVLQVYVTDLIHHSTQVLSHFTKGNQKPGPLQWSPTGDDITVFMGDSEGALREAWVISLKTKKMQRFNIPGQITELGSTLIWSEKGDKILIFGYADNESVRGLFWIDVVNNRLIHSLTEERANNVNKQVVSISSPFSMATDLSKVGFINNDGTLLIYSIPDQKIGELVGLEVLKQGFLWNIRAFPDDLFSCQN